jgi:hypothetical protein
MFTYELNRKIAALFGLPQLSLLFMNARTETDEPLQVNFIWMAVVTHFEYDVVLVGAVRTSHWHRGILAITRGNPYNIEFAGSPYPMDIANLKDPVEESLKSVDMTYDNSVTTLGTAAYSFNLLVETSRSSSRMSIRNGPRKPEISPIYHLWKSIQGMIYILALRYDNPEINKIVGLDRLKHYK